MRKTQKGYFSTPALKINIKKVNYIVKDTSVTCIIVPELPCNSPYNRIMSAGCALGAIVNVFPIDESKEKQICKKNERFPFDRYSYVGVARLKEGDTPNIELAKKVAYKKAYRQMLKYYRNSMFNTYVRISEWLGSVFYNLREDCALGHMQDTDCMISDLTCEIHELLGKI